MSGIQPPQRPTEKEIAEKRAAELVGLRDWFAGMALQGNLARHYYEKYTDAARSAYRFANAMLKAREVKS